ncbi:2-phosphoxylose phosphatase 1-like [Ornithodoros turicata]|uniref:2-phosphoxylose phosphatase 1-like n=1 Tax=Ornithodoros turicata TaxID=34597 RepID=UPI003138E561
MIFLMPSAMKFLSRHRVLFASFIMIWIVGMVITVSLIGHTGEAKVGYMDNLLGHSVPLHNGLPPMDSFKMMKPVKYCNPHDSVPIGQEGKVQGNLTLETVVVLIRHGERMPLRQVRDGFQLSCGDKITLGNPIIKKYFTTIRKYHQLHSQKQTIFSSFATHPNLGACPMGHLTWSGVLQHIQLGSALSRIYNGNLWRLLPEGWSADSVRFYSTVFSRTYQSALAFLYGFLPAITLEKLRIIPSTDINFCFDGRCSCSQLRIYEKHLTRKTKRMLNNHPAVMRLLEEVNAILKPTSNSSDIVAARPLMDVLMGFVCQGKTLPCLPGTRDCANIDHVRNIMSYLDWEGRQLADDSAFRKSSILKTYSLLNEVHRRIRDTFEGRSGIRFLLFSGHDINLTPVSSALGFDDGVIPPYASRIVLEAYSSPRQGNDRYLRVLYNGKDVTKHVTFCGGIKLAHKSGSSAVGDVALCPFRNFTNFLERDVPKLFSAQNFLAACGIDGATSTTWRSS